MNIITISWYNILVSKRTLSILDLLCINCNDASSCIGCLRSVQICSDISFGGTTSPPSGLTPPPNYLPVQWIFVKLMISSFLLLFTSGFLSYLRFSLRLHLLMHLYSQMFYFYCSPIINFHTLKFTRTISIYFHTLKFNRMISFWKS